MGEIFWELENGKLKAMNTVWIVVFAGRGTGRCCISKCDKAQGYYSIWDNDRTKENIMI